MSDSFSISELAREFAITTRAIRFYEDKQLLTPTRVGNTRVYSRADRTRLKLVLRGKRLGWPLDDIKQVIELYDVPAGDGEYLQLEAMVSRLRKTRHQLQAQQQDLLESLAEIDELESNCVDLLNEKTVAGKVTNTGNNSATGSPATDSAKYADSPKESR